MITIHCRRRLPHLRNKFGCLLLILAECLLRGVHLNPNRGYIACTCDIVRRESLSCPLLNDVSAGVGALERATSEPRSFFASARKPVFSPRQDGAIDGRRVSISQEIRLPWVWQR